MHTRTRSSRYLIALLAPLLLLAAACSNGNSSTATATPQPVATTAVAATSGTGVTTGNSGATAATAKLHGTVAIDFTGAPQQHDGTPKPFAVDTGTKGLDAIKAALGDTNISTKDFGGSLGVFVTGLYGIEAEGNHFWEFTVNGKSSDVGVSTYEVKDGDALGFKYSSY
ncbi:MAG TPA: DUF4430 domain-containing protein [Dehalococcoidia bacterium]|nr:DUF4430 domain-containing protein [Dehalococcoidia bacterium]